ncbi:amino acid permease/ SLC12A domain-containing protein [Halteromyces radiatus]|uniref:amino acid permease/ SLC12A domain-containing protein n=1 Tax=Halteromyces radiatus TaxID=101107 RepID=UPI00221F3679|nr:amino acid permease/ SLC12A domain-containing protein [Halteromyces radiatus]KAI8086017.1 amino acid permease/ SLC12A domain-containing protein [Halteromyces radiatus]
MPIDEETGLKRDLKPRHLAMISIGGTIGQGLFLSSGANLSKAGPAGLLIAYMMIGTVAYFVALQLGEMSAYIPISGSFTVYCRRFVHKSFGNAVGYNYVFCWSIIVAVELTAIPLVMKFWTNVVPDWAWSAIFLVVMFLINLFGAKAWGESEYWFTLIKILAVLLFVIVGCLTSGGVLGGTVYGFKYWSDPGAFSNGVLGVINALVLAALTMTGVEIVGVSAGESKNPAKSIPSAVRNVFYRIVCIYLASVFVMGMVIPYNDPHNFATGHRDVSISPFTLVFQKAGLEGAAHVVNAVILTTLLSCGNSGMYVTTRTLQALAKEGIAHRKLAYTTKSGVPIYALFCTCAVSLVCFLTSFIPGEVLFLVLSDLGGIAGLITWAAIAIAHYRFRKAFLTQGHQLSELPYVAMGYPFANFFVAVACVIIIIISGWSYFVPASPQGLVGSYGGPIIFIGGMVIHKFWTKSNMVPIDEVDVISGARMDWKEDSILALDSKSSFWNKLVSIFT